MLMARRKKGNKPQDRPLQQSKEICKHYADKNRAVTIVKKVNDNMSTSAK